MAVKPAPQYPNKRPNMSEGRNHRVVVANVESEPAPATKTDGIKIRGTGAATKGLIARGPMA